MDEQAFVIPNISCGATIHTKLQELEGVETVSTQPLVKSLIVEWKQPTSLSQIESKLDQIGYPVQSVIPECD